jgi:hypothetical protein
VSLEQAPAFKSHTCYRSGWRFVGLSGSPGSNRIRCKDPAVGIRCSGTEGYVQGSGAEESADLADDPTDRFVAGSFSLTNRDSAQVLRINRNEFKGAGGKTLEWSKIATFDVTLVDEATNTKLDLTSAEGRKALRLIRLVDPR